MIYFGSTDGMMHAVCATVNTEYGCDIAGRELWAYIPRPMLPDLKEATAHIDGSPHVIDAYGNFDNSGAAWRTIMLFSTGSGSMQNDYVVPAVYAIDITTPDNPKILWEYAVTTTGSRGTLEMGASHTLTAGPVLNASSARKYYVWVQSNNGGTGGAGSVVTALDVETGTLVWQKGDIVGNTVRVSTHEPMPSGAMPGIAYHLARIAREEGRDLSSLSTIILGAEKITPGLRHKMAETLEACGARQPRILATYGFTEARQAFAECPTDYEHSSGYHLFPDLSVVEIIDPETLEPVGEGEAGEVVFTAISGHGSCVLRYRTGDMAMGGVTWEPCPHCSRTVPRLSADLRRVSDTHALELTKVRGTLVDLPSLGGLLSDDPAVEEWQVVMAKKDDDPHELDELRVRVSLKGGANRERWEKTFRTRVVDQIEVSPNQIHFYETSKLLELLGMETEMKEKRYLDLRP
jgi:hypothetical protein